ncbi:VHS-domain-containing protein [Schizophyllum commune Loenen D]|nr:VHS-domain-containing protein [Schizophyllum commune Loenen D]
MLNSPTMSSWMRTSPIEILITRACDPSLPEPNYALHLEVAEYINQKKANNPREAAMLIARLANHRNPHIAILALALLDTLVQSCGYPFHLQISTKEFLNELVRRFPERPPPFPGPVMSRILDLIQGWKEGICSESRWKDDLGNIRDMHRLLTFKGYRFRDTGRQPSLASASNIKSAEELEEEDREAQSAKLQELIRRGTPRDLAAAQEIMKALAGANPDAKPDYRAQALTDINKLEQKVILLNEMLDNADVEHGERFVGGDVYEQVATILQNARPKIQKLINEAETEDSESLDTYLQINDQINSVLNRYEAYKRGDYEAAKNPVPAELAGSSQSNGGANNGISLIDFDDSAPAPSGGTSNADDLMSLFGSPSPAAATTTTTPATAYANQTQTAQPQPQVANNGKGYGMAMLMGSGVAGGPPSSTTPPAAIRLPTSPRQNSGPSHTQSTPGSRTQSPVVLPGARQSPALGGGAQHAQSPLAGAPSPYFPQQTPGFGQQSPAYGQQWGQQSPSAFVQQPQFGQQPQFQPGTFGQPPAFAQQPPAYAQQQAQSPFAQGSPIPGTPSAAPAPAAAPQQPQQKDPFADLAGLF